VRIIGGTHKGRVIKVPAGLPVRPTTDFAKEALFNILSNKVDFEQISVLDLFSGTGHISLEFASRGSKKITAVDRHVACVKFLQAKAREMDFLIQTVKGDVFDYLKKPGMQLDLVFADPPYDMENIGEIANLIFENNILSNTGMLIIEHGPHTKLQDFRGFTRHRKYGNVNFSFFEK
jgi:16S rRNA (guanine966-N2)-methyltransferase